MNKIAIVYWSGTGNTEAMAQLAAQGAATAGKLTDLILAADFTAAQAAEYEAIGFGCPSMGAEQLEETEFQPMYDAVRPSLSGKPVVLFGSYGWGNGEWMQSWAEDCEAAGARLVASPVIANGAPAGSVAEDCEALGAALAKA